MDLRHSSTSLLHRLQGLVIDIRRLDRVYLLLQLHNLRRRLLKILLQALFPSKRGLGGCNHKQRIH